MTKEDVIRLYSKSHNFPSFVNITWLRQELEPLLKQINPDGRISWACNSCVKNQMAVLNGWLQRQEVETLKPKKKKRNVRKAKKK